MKNNRGGNCLQGPGTERLWKFLPHGEAGGIWSKDEVGFEDCQEDGSVGNKQADA